MEFFRKLAGNLFFKLVISLVILSFVLFGVSDFILGNSGSWVAKVGKKDVSYGEFLQQINTHKKLIRSFGSDQETEKYLQSKQFEEQVLTKLINEAIVEKLQQHYGFTPSRELILQSIAKDYSFKDENGKFDQTKFSEFLSKRGFDEEKYINEIANRITTALFLQTISSNSPVNKSEVFGLEKIKQEQRFVDLITISKNDLGKINAPTNEELKQYYESNKERYKVKEFRKISYLTFSKKELIPNFLIKEEELKSIYNNNKSQYQQAETRSFYHAFFEDKQQAQNFKKEIIKADNKNIRKDFAKLAKKLLDKNEKDIKLSNITQEDFLPELSDQIFKNAKNEVSEVLKSSMGYHVFLTTQINKGEILAYEKVKEEIKINLIKERQENILNEKMTAIDDELLASNSLEKVKEKFSLKDKIKSITFNDKGENKSSKIVDEYMKLVNLIENTFALQNGQVSKIFHAINGPNFYVVKLNDIIPARIKDFAEVDKEVREDLMNERKDLALKKLAQNIADEIKENPKLARKIAKKHKVSLKSNKKFNSFEVFKSQGQEIPYQSPLQKEIYKLRIGQSTPPVEIKKGKYQIAVLNNTKQNNVTSDEFAKAANNESKTFINSIMNIYNKTLQERFPIKVNEKFFTQK